MKKIFIPLFVFVLIAGGVLIFRNQNVRGPSSVKSNSSGVLQLIDDDLSKNENKKQIKRALLQSLDWNFSVETSRLVLKIENIKFSNGGEAVDLCTAFPSINLSLEAPEITYSGEHPEINVLKACEATGSIITFEIDLSFLSDLSALKTIKAQSKVLNSRTEVGLIRIANWDDETPDKWRVKQLSFLSDSPAQNQNFEITKYEIISVLGYSVEFQGIKKKQ